MDGFVQRLQLAAELSDENGYDAADLPDAAGVAANCSSWGVTAQLKLHQAEGVAWLIRRYDRGVNVILGWLFVPHNSPSGQGFSIFHAECLRNGLGLKWISG